MKMEDRLSIEELEKMEPADIEIDESTFKVDQSICPHCQRKMDKVIENKDLFNGAVTFHIIKFRCEDCKKEYLDLEQAEKYDLFLNMKKISQKTRPLEVLHQCLSNGRVKVPV